MEGMEGEFERNEGQLKEILTEFVDVSSWKTYFLNQIAKLIVFISLYFK